MTKWRTVLKGKHKWLWKRTAEGRKAGVARRRKAERAGSQND